MIKKGFSISFHLNPEETGTESFLAYKYANNGDIQSYFTQWRGNSVLLEHM